MKFEEREFAFSVTFCLPSPSSDLKVPTLNGGERGGSVDCLPVIYFCLMLRPTSCLASLAPMVIPSSQYSNFSFNISVVLIYCRTRLSKNKYCCCSLAQQFLFVDRLL